MKLKTRFMLLPIKAICNPRKQRKDGTCVVYIQYCYSSQSRTLLDTGVAIPPDFWNNKKRCITDRLPSTFGNTDDLNQKIFRSLRIVEDIISYTLKIPDLDPVKFLKEKFSPDFNMDLFLAGRKLKGLEKGERLGE